MSNYNNKSYGSTEYYEEELKQKTLIAELVKEAVRSRLAQTNCNYLMEELSVAVLSTADSVKWATQELENAKAKEKGGVDNENN